MNLTWDLVVKCDELCRYQIRGWVTALKKPTTIPGVKHLVLTPENEWFQTTQQWMFMHLILSSSDVVIDIVQNGQWTILIIGSDTLHITYSSQSTRISIQGLAPAYLAVDKNGVDWQVHAQQLRHASGSHWTTPLAANFVQHELRKSDETYPNSLSQLWWLTNLK